jgi:iron complex transport system substrate-binding protein
LRYLMSIMVACVLIAGCERKSQSTTAAPLVVTDDAQRSVQLLHPATRVVSLLPSVTDLIVAMGRAHVLIARTDYDEDPRLAKLPSVGGGLTPSVEWLAAQKPDLVVSWPDQGTRSIVTHIVSVGVPVYAASTETIEDALRTLRNVGVLLHATSAADSLERSITAALDSTRQSVAGMRRVRVAYVLSIDPTFIAGPGTFIDELIRVAGGENVFGDLKQSWPQVSLEEFALRDPDVIVLARDSDEPAQEVVGTLPGWRNLRAVKARHVYRVSAHYFNRPGPLMPRAARELANFFSTAR